MARINLLPWREELRQEKKKEFLTLLAGVGVLGLLVAFVWVQSVDSAIEAQKARNNMLKSEIKVLEKQVQEIKELKKKRKALLDRMSVIQDLEGKRSIIVHYFDEFTKSVPDGVFVEKITREGDLISVSGISESNSRVSAFMRRLVDSDWFSDPNPLSVTGSKDRNNPEMNFKLEFKAVLPEGPEGEDG